MARVGPRLLWAVSSWQVPYTFYVKDTEVMETLEQTVTELGERLLSYFLRTQAQVGPCRNMKA